MTNVAEGVSATCMQGVRWCVEGGEWHSLAEQRDAVLKLLSSLVGAGMALDHDEHGAPFLPARPDLNVSISHCRTAVAVAVSERGRVGIDVECRRKVSQALIDRVCTCGESQSIASAKDPIMQFLRLWTRKEAVLKCRGTGIRGFGSMVEALGSKDIETVEVETGLVDTVAAVAVDRSVAMVE